MLPEFEMSPYRSCTACRRCRIFTVDGLSVDDLSVEDLSVDHLYVGDLDYPSVGDLADVCSSSSSRAAVLNTGSSEVQDYGSCSIYLVYECVCSPH